MPLLHDPSLDAHAAQTRNTYDVARAALPAAPEGRGLGDTDLPTPLPAEVTAALTQFQAEWAAEHGTPLRLAIVQYFRTVNGELQPDGWTLPGDPGADPVQVSQTIAVASAGGAYVEVRQWIARAETGP